MSVPESARGSRMRPEEIGRRTFAKVRKGYDPAEVASLLERFAAELSFWHEREQELLERLGDAETRAANPTIDDERLTSALGQKSAEVLRNAHEEASRLVAAAEETAASAVRDAHQQATDLQVRAEAGSAERIAQAELAAGSIRAEAQSDVTAILERARADGGILIDRARDRGRLMIEQAQETRRRMLTETAQRRRVLLIQIEQLRAARDQLARTVVGVRGTVDEIVSGLARADDDARAAAASIAERVAEVEVQEVEGLDSAEPEAIGAGTQQAPVDADPPVSTNGAGVQEPGEPPADGSRVDQLFARIRAGSVPQELGEDALASPAPAARPEPQEGDSGASQVEEDTVQPSELDRLRSERDELTEPIIVRMARRLKRSMQDDQNVFLHRLREEGGEYRKEVLSAEDSWRRGLLEASVDFLGDAFDAGEGFARGKLAPGVALPDVTEVNRSVVGTAAQELADAVVTQLRRRLLEDDEEGLGPTEEEAAELVSAAYREWRGERIERLAADHVVGAFSSGVRASAATIPLRWVSSGTGETCADCDDNALAEPVQDGERFPTGHLHPPAHTGCRCLVVPTAP